MNESIHPQTISIAQIAGDLAAQGNDISLPIEACNVSAISRQGSDLIIQLNDGGSYILEGYFDSFDSLASLFLNGQNANEEQWLLELQEANEDGAIAFDFKSIANQIAQTACELPLSTSESVATAVEATSAAGAAGVSLAALAAAVSMGGDSSGGDFVSGSQVGINSSAELIDSSENPAGSVANEQARQGAEPSDPKTIALAKIMASADGSLDGELTMQDFVDAGVIGVTPENLAEISSRVAATSVANVDSTAEVQALLDQYETDEQASQDETSPANESTPTPNDETSPAPSNETTPAPSDETAPAPIDETAPASSEEPAIGTEDKVAALAKIAAYAEDPSNPAPTVDDYAAAGVTGVTTDNLDAVNARVDAVTGVDADTTAEVQALVDQQLAYDAALAKIAAYAEDPSNPAPTVDDYAAAGVTGVTTDNLDAVNARVDAVTGVDADTTAEVQALVDQQLAYDAALAKIAAYAEDPSNPAPTVDDYAAAGVTGVTTDNLDAVNARVDAVTGVDADTTAEVQALVDQQLAYDAALAKIAAYAEDPSNPAPTVDDYAAAGVTGVTTDNLDAVNARVDAVTGVDADTTAEVQTVIGTPTTADVSAAGDEDAASIPVVLSGADLDGDITQYTLTNLPANGSLYTDAALTQLASNGVEYEASSNNLTLYFVPDSNWNGATTFNYVASDNDGRVDASPATATITVASVNDVPIAADDSVSTDENTVFVDSVPAAIDSDGVVLGYSLVRDVGVGNGTLTFSPEGNYTFDPGTDFDSLAQGASRDVTFTYTATDNEVAVSEPATVTITVNGRNDAPEAGIGEGALLGIASAAAVDTVDLTDQGIYAYDVDGNLSQVALTAQALATVALGDTTTPPTWEWSDRLATEFGIAATGETIDEGSLLELNYFSTLNVVSTDGGTLDNTEINEFLATVFYSPLKVAGVSLASVDVGTEITIEAVDDLAQNFVFTNTGAASASALDSDPNTQLIYEGDDNDNALVGNDNNNRMYGYDGNDTLDGLAGNDLLRGGNGDDILNGGEGNDSLIDGVGADIIDAGAGDDLIQVPDLTFASIDGGSGIDTLILAGEGIAFDLSGSETKIDNIEVINIDGNGANSLTLTEAVVLGITDANDVIRIEGDSEDTLNIDGAVKTGFTEINGNTYDTYQLGSSVLHVDLAVVTET